MKIDSLNSHDSKGLKQTWCVEWIAGRHTSIIKMTIITATIHRAIEISS